MKDKYIQVRVTNDEKANITDRARSAGLSLSEYARRGLVGKQIKSRLDIQTERERNIQIARVGNNLNQIAKFCWQQRQYIDSIEICEHLAAIESKLKELTNAH